MNKKALFENLSIYSENLSLYYIGSVLITIISVILAWWYHTNLSHKQQLVEEKTRDGRFEDDVPLTDDYEEFEEGIIGKDDEAVAQIRLGKYSKLAEKVASGLTEDQLNEEREMERKQLEAIFKLLQNEEDKFQVSSIEELQDQLKLYRP